MTPMAYRKSFRTFRRSSGRRFGRSYGTRRSLGLRGYGRFRRSRRVWSTSETKSNGNRMQYRSRRYRKRTYRNMLWKDTQFKDHWRSYYTTVNSLSTTGSTSTMNLGVYGLLVNASNEAFWDTSFGAVSKDNTVAVPNFRGVTLRGGVVRARIVIPPDENYNVYLVRTWIIWTPNNPNLSSVPSVPVSLAWDPSAHTDFDTEVGRAMAYKECYLSNTVNSTFEVEYRLRIMKVDMDNFKFSNSYQPLLLVGVACMNSTSTVNIGVWTEHNVSFVGDAVST